MGTLVSSVETLVSTADTKVSTAGTEVSTADTKVSTADTFISNLETISGIACLSGFQYPQHFTRFFKRLHLITFFYIPTVNLYADRAITLE